MKYYKEEATGNGWKPYEKTYITRDEALKLLCRQRLIELEGEKKLTAAQVGTAYQVRGGMKALYVGIEY